MRPDSGRCSQQRFIIKVVLTPVPRYCSTWNISATVWERSPHVGSAEAEVPPRARAEQPHLDLGPCGGGGPAAGPVGRRDAPPDNTQGVDTSDSARHAGNARHPSDRAAADVHRAESPPAPPGF